MKNLRLVELDKDNFLAIDYNNFAKSMDFWKHITTKKLLIFQTDSMLCGNSHFTLDEFEKFDFIGARTPWDFKLYGGNGGLSVRDTEKSTQCVLDYEDGKLENLRKYGEDGFVARCFKLGGHNGRLGVGKLPTDSDKDRFAIQNYFNRPAFGAHQTSVQLPENQKEAFHQYCPEYGDLR